MTGASRGAADPAPEGGLAAGLREIAAGLPDRLDLREDDVAAGLGRLVLTLLELVRQVLEHQAIRRMEGGSLTDEEIERLGLALMHLSRRLDEIREVFGLAEDDLNIDLGPLGRLL